MTQSQSWVGGMFLCGGCHRYKTQLCIWQVGDVELKLLWIFFFFFWCFQMKKQSEDRCAFPGHHGVTNLLFFHSVLPPSPCTSPGPAAGWRGGHMGIAGPVNQSSSFVWGVRNHLLYRFSLKDCILVLYCVRDRSCLLMPVTVPCVCFCVLWPSLRALSFLPTPTPRHPETTWLLCLVGAGSSTIPMFLCYLRCKLCPC